MMSNNYKRVNLIKLIVPSVVLLLFGAVLVSNNEAYAANVSYSIIYDTNVTSNMPTDVDTTSMSEQVTMANNTPTRPGFRYLGWCNVIPTSSGGTDLCTGGTTYQPSATLTLDQTGTGNNFHFYAMWGEETQSSCYTSPMISTVASGITYMQDINSGNKSTVLSALAQDATYQIKDNRDNETYCVGKLADGNLWLLDNLALDLTSSTVLSGMNENNTHASNTTLNYLKGTTTRNPSTDPNGQYATVAVSNWGSGFSYSAPLVNISNKDVIPSDATSQVGQYKVGGYYNYCAASAGSYCYGNGTSAGTSIGDATEDICPKGWRMPTGNTTGEYQALYNNASYNTYANYRSALHLSLSGYFYYGSVDNQGSYGRWWSSTRNDNYGMYYLYADTSSIYPANDYIRYGGNSVRCVLGS